MTRRVSAALIVGAAALGLTYAVFVQPFLALWLWWLWIGGVA